MRKKIVTIICLSLIGLLALSGCTFSGGNSSQPRNSNQVNQPVSQQTNQEIGQTNQTADTQEEQDEYDFLDDTPGDWLVGGDCYEEWPYEERPEITDKTFHPTPQNGYTKKQVTPNAKQSVRQNGQNNNLADSNYSQNNSGFSPEQQEIILDAANQVKNYLMSKNLPYRDMPLSIFEIGHYRNDGILGSNIGSKIILYGFTPGQQLTSTIIHELIHYQLQDFSKNAPVFWDETLTVMVVAEITGSQGQSYRDFVGQYKDIISAVARANNTDYETAQARSLAYFLKNDSSGLREYIDSSLTVNIFDKMTTDWNQNNKILNSGSEY